MMNAIDLLLGLIVLLAVWSGWHKGFIAGFYELATWLGSLVIAYFTYAPAAAFLHSRFPTLGAWSAPVAFAGIAIFARLFLALTLGRLLLAAGRFRRNPVDHALGTLPGLVNGLLFAAIVASILFFVPVDNALQATTRKSVVANALLSKAQWANEKLSPVFEDALEHSLTRTVKPKPNETVNLNFTVAHAVAKPELEARMLELVNEERQKEGLKPVVADPALTRVARAHSQDMFARGYFSHYTPEKKDPFDRMRAAGVSFQVAGENLALGQTLPICHRGLMNSPGHRANILQPSFGRLGIGILDGGIYGLMISQEFRD
ncbi:MAG: hypothetical protein JWP27_1966 [Flaviaesturariibacter sp.]|nr:hypothetical protein [Flaviaesturariibacter sp.]